jgi:hypothetical protein
MEIAFYVPTWALVMGAFVLGCLVTYIGVFIHFMRQL